MDLGNNIMQTFKLNYRLCLISVLIVFTSACSTLKSTDSLQSQRLSDPLESFNRSVYGFNTIADKTVLKPIASAYHSIVPNIAERSIGHFFKNLGEPLNIVNNLLQGKADGALNSTYRFAVNSTVGVLGLFDVAKTYNVDRKPEDLGQTLATWGVKPGPYLILPFFGPSNIRDTFSRISSTVAYYPIDSITESNRARLALFALDTVDSRARLFGVDDTLDNQLDPYLFLRDAYENSRINSIYDGKVPVFADDEFDF